MLSFQMNSSGGDNAHAGHAGMHHGMNHGSMNHGDMNHSGMDHMDHGAMHHNLAASSTTDNACSDMAMHHGMSVRIIQLPRKSVVSNVTIFLYFPRAFR